MTTRVAAEHAWAQLAEARQVLEDARKLEAEAVENRRRAEQHVERAEGVWREALADAGHYA
jgi:hypothetical protein